jgi:hypothetical protein
MFDPPQAILSWFTDDGYENMGGGLALLGVRRFLKGTQDGYNGRTS